MNDVGEPAPTDKVAALAELGLLAATLVHELRQPLFAARGTLQLAPADGAAAPAISDALRHLAHAQALLDHYGALGRSSEPFALVDLSERVSAAVDLISATARQSNVTVRHSFPERIPWIRARPSAVTQVATNLVRNAVEAAESVAGGQVNIEIRRENDVVVLVIDDNGGGVPEAVLARLGEPWVSTKGANGTGLGLYLSVRLVAEVGGELKIDKNEMGGASVRVVLPAA